MSRSPSTVVVRHLERDRLQIGVGAFELIADQPVQDGGDGTGPSPVELFLAGLASCVAFYAERFLRRHGMTAEGLTVSCDFEWAENPHRVGEIELVVDAPGLEPGRHDAFKRVIEHCTVHNTLQHAASVHFSLEPKAAKIAS